LVLDVAPGERAALEELVRREMGAAFPLSVPMEVSIGAGQNWNGADH
jgi:DNA polymerase-1